MEEKELMSQLGKGTCCQKVATGCQYNHLKASCHVGLIVICTSMMRHKYNYNLAYSSTGTWTQDNINYTEITFMYNPLIKYTAATQHSLSEISAAREFVLLKLLNLPWSGNTLTLAEQCNC